MILQRLQPFYHSSRPQPFHQDTNEILHMYKHQAVIGWDNFIRGRISKYFKVFMSRHYKKIRSKRKPDIWVKAIISNMLNIHLDSW